MGSFTGYTCDKCGKEFRGKNINYFDEQPVCLSLGINFGSTTRTQQGGKQAAVWCRSCVMKTGVHVPSCAEDKKIAPPTPLSFEDKFVILLNELGFIQEE